MRRIFLILLSFVLVSALPADAQNKRKGKKKANTPELPSISLSEAIQQYRFEEAELLLNARLADYEKSGRDTREVEDELRVVQTANSRMQATEQVVFIDSLVVPENQLFSHLKLSNECGKIMSYADYFGQEASTEFTVFVSQLGNQIFFSAPNEKKVTQLYTSELLGNEWTNPSTLKFINDNEELVRSYPFVLSDGTTLYFAAKGEGSLGGYDIFMTRYDADEHRFLEPENIGMPFNSMGNDYLYLVDEYYNIGYFVSDRNQKPGQVCIYTFIPNSTRKIYNATALSANKLRSLARLNAIKDTWTDNKLVTEAKARLQEARSQQTDSPLQRSGKYAFVGADDVVFASASDFPTEECRTAYKEWVESNQQLSLLSDKLKELRSAYAQGVEEEQSNLTPQILDLEREERLLLKSIKEKELKLRQLLAGSR